jgi:two-component system, cell cycle response regulator
VSAASKSSEIGRQPALRLLVGAVLFGGTALIALHNWAGFAAAAGGFVNGPLYDAVVLSAAVACFIRARRGGRERAAWLVIGLTILSQAVTEFSWTLFYADDPTPPFPSACDLGWLAFYPLATIGLALMVRARARSLDWRLWTDALIAALGTAALGAAFVFEFVADRAGGTALQRAVTLAYPLGDILMLALVVGIIALSRWRPGRTWTLLLLGLVSLVFADIATTLQTAATPSAYSSGWITPFYMLGALSIGIEAWQRRPDPIRPAGRIDDRRELMVPGLFGLITIGLFAIQYVKSVSLLTAVLSAATMLAVVIRLAVSVVENRNLLEQVRTDPLTGLGNQGGLQVDLAGHCRGGETPVTLLLLDLNGFKQFNDTFGHPAGDRMLAELGHGLQRVLGADGSAYRIGGDEFAVVLECERERVPELTRRVAEALTARGEDYLLGASWGSVAIPEEASAPQAALQLADVRMYAQKQSRRAARGDAPDEDDRLRLIDGRNGEALQQRQ